ncbi:hypothetical protein BDZ94DRAFT_1232114 [Collybia nuda]|uniref:Uncharacterized protein n=1 Tax=Collybia nuda TaxID=64659 RepID=A0A9P5YEJ3_9AGAR|nr:hypothetical protein BDZ94DRAFT_1232114 [Collybia nuda]
MGVSLGLHFKLGMEEPRRWRGGRGAQVTVVSPQGTSNTKMVKGDGKDTQKGKKTRRERDSLFYFILFCDHDHAVWYMVFLQPFTLLRGRGDRNPWALEMEMESGEMQVRRGSQCEPIRQIDDWEWTKRQVQWTFSGRSNPDGKLQDRTYVESGSGTNRRYIGMSGTWTSCVDHVEVVVD